MKLKDKTILITGSSRGIGRAMALRFAKEGASIVIAAKSNKPHPTLPGTIHSVAEEVLAAGGKCLALCVDVRSDDDIHKMVQETVKRFSGIDVLINNAGAIHLGSILDTSSKKYDLMYQINSRAVFMATREALPYLRKSHNPHILNLSPPLSFNPKWFKDSVAYTGSKYLMSLYTIGLAEELRDDRISVNSLWPKTLIRSSATEWIVGKEKARQMREPTIVAEAAMRVITTFDLKLTGQLLIDEDILRQHGETDFSHYAVDPTAPLISDYFVG